MELKNKMVRPIQPYALPKQDGTWETIIPPGWNELTYEQLKAENKLLKTQLKNMLESNNEKSI